MGGWIWTRARGEHCLTATLSQYTNGNYSQVLSRHLHHDSIPLRFFLLLLFQVPSETGV